MPMAIPAVATAVTSFGLTASASLYAATGLYLSAAAISATAVAAANVAISVAVNALMQPKVGTSGPVGSYKSDPAAPIRGVMGRMAVGGNRIFKRTWGRTNVYLTSVALLSLGPCQAVEQFKANDQFVSFTQGQGGASGKYAGHMWMTYRYGLPGTSALTPPQGVFIENPKLTAWTSQHRADGHVTAMWTLAQAEDVQKRDLYTQGEPDALWIGRWMKVWDPRQDSTYPGGSGSQRRDQWNTWAYSDNPYLHALAWIRGHAKLNADGTVDRTKRIAGVGAPERAIDIAAYVEGANIADANGWKIAGEWSTSDDKWQVLAAMLQAGGGVPLNRGAQISCMVNTPRASIYTYTRNDLVGGATVKALKARRDRKNTVVPRYRSEAHGWEIVPAGAVTSSVYRDEDRGEPRTIEIEYSYVTSAKQAGELGAYDVANMREGLETSLPSKPHLLGLRAGDAFTTDLPELGLVAQKFIVQRRAFDPQTGVVTLDVLSETDAKHAWALGQTENPPPTPQLSDYDPSVVPAPEEDDWTLTPELFTDNGVSIPALVLNGAVQNFQADAVVFDYRPVASPEREWAAAGIDASTTVRKEIAGALTNGTQYEVSIRYRVHGVIGDRLVLGPVTAGNFSLTGGTGARRPVGRSVTYPTSATSDTITVQAFSAYMQDGSTIQVPGAVISGLDPSTIYGVFWKEESGFEVEPDPAPVHMTTGSWLLIGYQATSDAAGDYPQPPPRPGGYCPHEDTPILLANPSRDGPGASIRAGDVFAGMWVWTLDERTWRWGAYRVSAADPAEADLVVVEMCDGRAPRFSAGHRLGLKDDRRFAQTGNLKAGDEIDGQQPGTIMAMRPAGRGRVIRLTVDGARSFISDGLLSHNAKMLEREEF